MYCMYSFLERERIEFALRLYLGREPQDHETARLYLYLALSGYLWSLWAHYKNEVGEDYGDYGPKTNAYMLEYYPLLTGGDLMERALAASHDAVRSGSASARRAAPRAAASALGEDVAGEPPSFDGAPSGSEAVAAAFVGLTGRAADEAAGDLAESLP
jgi:hypothetical protein